MGNKKIGLGLMFNLIGAMFAYLIGSGFASGQETMQYFSGWGSVWTSLGVAVIALLRYKNVCCPVWFFAGYDDGKGRHPCYKCRRLCS